MNQKKTGTISLLILAGILGAVLGYYGLPHNRSVKPETRPPVAQGQKVKFSTPSATVKTYRNDQYGFAITYPRALTPKMKFGTSYLLADRWRYDAAENSTGIPVVSIPVVRIENQTTYPRFYNVEVRIGVSTDPHDVQSCTTNLDNGGKPVPTAIINGIPFTVFPIQDAAMMKYVSGLSYRAVHNHTCYVMEQIKSGSNYRDTVHPKDIPQATLDSYFQQAGAIVKTFKFTK